MWSPRAASQPVPTAWHSWWLPENGWPQRRLQHTLPDGFPVIGLLLQAPGDQVWVMGTSPIHAKADSMGSMARKSRDRGHPQVAGRRESGPKQQLGWAWKRSQAAPRMETNEQMMEMCLSRTLWGLDEDWKSRKSIMANATFIASYFLSQCPCTGIWVSSSIGLWPWMLLGAF